MMNSARRVGLMVMLVIGLFCGGANAFAINIVTQGKPACVIVLSESPTEAEVAAAGELVEHLKLITGHEPAIVRADESEHAAGTRDDGLSPIYLGAAAGSEVAKQLAEATAVDGAFILAVNAKDVRIAGLGQGVRYGVSELLEQLGVRWFMPGAIGTVLPEGERLTLAEQQTVQSPSFASRHFQGLDATWKLRVRNGGQYFPSAHGLPGINPKMFEQHPEYFSLVRGKRTSRQICLSNAEVLSRVTEAIRERFRKQPGLAMIGLGPNDGGGFCECENCTALDGDDYDPFTNEHSVTDRYVWFFNQILTATEEEFPDGKIGFYIYHSYMRPPVRYTAHRNLAGALAPISLCRIHGPDNPLCSEKQYYATLMRDWCEALGGNVWERGYWSNLADPGFVFINIHRLREQIPLAKEANLRNWRVETFGHYGTQLPSFYIAAKLMWNHEADVDALVRDFAVKFYGPAAEPMEAYTWLMNDALRDADYHTGSAWDLPNIYSESLRQKAGELLDRAALLVSPDMGAATADLPVSVYAERVRLARDCFAMTDHFVRMMDARSAMDLTLAGEELGRLNGAASQLLASEPPMVDRRIFTAYMKRFFTPATEQGAARVTDGNRLLAAAGDEWLFRIDPSAVGETLRWFDAKLTGDNWQTILTCSKSWGDQGLRYYKGIAWYRTTVSLPADVAGQRVFLWCGGADEKAKVWVNGKEIGISGGSAFIPFEMDATDAVQAGENTITIAVSNTRLDELGTGGLVAPVILYIPKAGKDAVLENKTDLRSTFP